jgi:hypothetical protein
MGSGRSLQGRLRANNRRGGGGGKAIHTWAQERNLSITVRMWRSAIETSYQNEKQCRRLME